VEEYTIEVSLRGYPQVMNLKEGDLIARAGSWNGLSLVDVYFG